MSGECGLCGESALECICGYRENGPVLMKREDDKVDFFDVNLEHVKDIKDELDDFIYESDYGIQETLLALAIIQMETIKRSYRNREFFLNQCGVYYDIYDSNIDFFD